jgi:hypothetical protein
MVEEVRFILIQEGIVDIANSPAALAFSFLDVFAPFKVAIGCVNEFNKAEIVGIVAEGRPTESCNVWYISSELDGLNRMVGITGRMSDFVRGRLCNYYQSGKFSDLCNLPQMVTINGGTI